HNRNYALPFKKFTYRRAAATPTNPTTTRDSADQGQEADLHAEGRGSRLGAELFEAPKHPYTQALLSAVPVPDPAVQRTRERVLLGADMLNPIEPPPGRTFHTRCPVAEERCSIEVPSWRTVGGTRRQVRCHLVGVDGTAPDITTRPTGGRPAHSTP
ncbi:MAG: hypothetical protein GEU81_17905, partial [Nitriliruptorales bacterium]|nr:hypothetical protein [Nitriliruptorales bacterium]